MKGVAWWKKLALVILALCGLGLVLLPAPESGYHGFHPRVQGLYIVAFLLVALPLIWILIPRLRQFVLSRFVMIKSEMEESQRQFLEAEQRLRNAQARLENLAHEVEALTAEFRRLGEKEREALIHEGVLVAQRIRGETEFAMSQAAKMARKEVYAALVDAVLNQVTCRLRAAPESLVEDVVLERFTKEVERIGRI